MFSLAVDTAKLNKLKDKMDKYPPYAINAGLKAMNSFMNESSFKRGSYPPSRSGQAFVWSSEKQRKFVFANIDLPSVRTFSLADTGTFTVNETNFMIEYSNSSPWWQYVLHPSYQIIGHRIRGWLPINNYVVNQAGRIVWRFRPAAIAAWDEMETFMFGGGGGL